MIVPKEADSHRITLLIDGSRDSATVQAELEILFGKDVILEAADADIIQKTLSKYYRRKERSKTASKVHVTDQNTDDFLQKLIVEAKDLGASDIHVEIYEEQCRVRMRIDGQLIERYTIEKEDYPALINKIKINANLDIAEKRLPQDGRIFFSQDDDKFDIRVSVLPSLYGEKAVLRLLSTDATDINIDYLGFTKEELRDYLQSVRRPNGIVLISGPTGSGKTTTLYATLKILNKEKTNILTIEDPIEYTLDGINQVQLKESIGLTFASALKTFMRQDPDVIMLGEIRDGETAQMAIRAALTGHLVLSTIHTNSAWGTISRLTDMGVPAYLLANTMNISIAQRLIRLLCPDCRTEETFESELYPKGYNPGKVLSVHSVAKGCESCYFTGYKGRKALYEVIPIDREFADLIKNDVFDIDAQLKERNIKTLADNAFELFAKGVTSLEEVYPLLLSK
ncbi:MAG: type II/IV secretion system protein [Flavobacteriales bacterium]|nr:type II/IV secretion system protein [Flavobacteriales bacterium]